MNRLRPWQRRSADIAGGLLLASGTVWLAVHYTVGAGTGNLPNPLEAWAMRLHGLAAMGALFALGLLAGGHMPQGWRVTAAARGRVQRRLGLALAVQAALLVASGYLLYYFCPEDWRPALGIAHSAFGFAMAGLLVRHRRWRRRAAGMAAAALIRR